MKKLRIKTSHLVSASAVAGLAMGATIALAAHPPIQLYTYEEVAQQMGFPKAPVMVDATKKSGLPYSPKQTCFGSQQQGDGSTIACHGSVATNPKLAKGYADLADHAFHAALGYNEWMDNEPSGLFIAPTGTTFTDPNTGIAVPAGTQTGLNPQKPWLQSHGHNGKW